MITTETHIVLLACVTCGSNVEIYNSMSQLACKHCGTLLIVERNYGSVNLRGYAETVTGCLPNTDGVVSDVANVLLENELQLAESKHFRKQRHWKAIRTNRLNEWKVRLRTTRSKLNSIKRITAIVTVFPAGLIAAAAFSTAKNITVMELAAIISVVSFVVFYAVTIRIVREFLKSSETYGLARLKKECWREFVKMDGRIASEMDQLEKQIFVLKTKLHKSKYSKS